MELSDRLWSKIRIGHASARWEWTAYCDNGGYGRIRINGKSERAHRTVRFIIDGRWSKVVMHKCDNPSCCNPRHLVAGTQADNIADRHRKGRTSRATRCAGASNPMAKLTAPQVARIRALRGFERQADLAREYGVTQSTISTIQLARSWAGG